MKANPGKATIGTAGVGSAAAHRRRVLPQLTGTTAQFVPYRGGGPAMQDLVAGQIDLMFGDPTSALPQVRAGTIKALAITAPERLRRAAGGPECRRGRVAGLHVATWNALFAPKGTPADIIARLNAAAVAALADPAVRSRLADLGQDMSAARPADAAGARRAYYEAEIEKWWPIIKAAGIKPE